MCSLIFELEYAAFVRWWMVLFNLLPTYMQDPDPVNREPDIPSYPKASVAPLLLYVVYLHEHAAPAKDIGRTQKTIE